MERPCGRTWQPGHFDAALDSCETAIATDPGYFRAWSNSGWVLGISAAMTRPLTPAIRLSLSGRSMPKRGTTAAFALGALGRYAEAVTSYDCVIAINPEDADAWFPVDTPCGVLAGRRKQVPRLIRPLPLIRDAGQ
jgi:tetratricopeptide (TPR) repeat protein